jgi:sporulation protein YlmC with PRC-barrel domain
MGTERRGASAPREADAAAGEVISLSGIIDRPVYGSNGEELGTVVNVFADLLSHRLLYALLEVGGFLGIGSRRILIPFASLGWSEDRLSLPVDRPMLEHAPEWDRANVIDDGYQAEVMTYWDVSSGWRTDEPVIGPGSDRDR